LKRFDRAARNNYQHKDHDLKSNIQVSVKCLNPIRVRGQKTRFLF
jgi:hypothetical protein